MRSGKGRIIVGVDFGTTYTGVAAVYSKKPDEILLIKTWPSGHGTTTEKVPTELSYEKRQGDDTDSQQQTTKLSASQPAIHRGDICNVRFGYELESDEGRIKYIKLFLDRTQDFSRMTQAYNVPEELSKHGRSIEDAVADFLARIHQHILTTLKEYYPPNLVENTAVQFVLTVPAVWTDHAKDATLRAARRAGMGRNLDTGYDIGIVSEPEAAAIHTLHAMQTCGLRVGDNFVICDAGGGTVDLISYAITKLDPLRVKEITTGTGGLCGSSFLNVAFEEYIRERMGVNAYTAMKQGDVRVWQTALQKFEYVIKRGFSGRDNATYNVPLPGIADSTIAGVQGGFLSLTSRQVQGIFDPVVDQVIALVSGQVRRIQKRKGSLAAIVLVGGFAQSSYLHSRLSAHFQRDSDIEILRPSDAWTAVARGAVLYGLRDDFVSERRARYHYGCTYDDLFDDKIHTAEQRIFDDEDEVWRAQDCMQWYVRKNEPVSAKRTVSFPMKRNFLPGQPLQEDYALWACGDAEPPTYKAFDDGLIKVCQLILDLSQVPDDKFIVIPRSEDKGGPYKRLEYNLVMRIDSAKLNFNLEIKGKSYGGVEASFAE